MKRHNGMRPQDIVILLKVLSMEKRPNFWYNRDLSTSLYISQSEVSESLYRSEYAGLIDAARRNVSKNSLLEFLTYGIRYVYPQQPGGYTRGLETAHSAPFHSSVFISSQKYVWPDPFGSVFGIEVEPLYSTVPKACKEDPFLYETLSLVDMLRVGKSREASYAKERLQRMLYEYRS